jgi:hypothetical protein
MNHGVPFCYLRWREIASHYLSSVISSIISLSSKAMMYQKALAFMIVLFPIATIADHDDHHHHSDRNLVESVDGGRRCGQRVPTEEEMKFTSDIVNAWVAKKSGRFLQATTTVVPTFFHIITDGSNGDKTDEDIQVQLDVINEAFASHGFSFTLEGITRTDNSAWYSDTENEEFYMKQALRQGGSDTLNVYLANLQNYLGWAYFPYIYADYPVYDGVVILTETIPGGIYGPAYSEGDTLTHEVGHWLGLYHTFDGGCDAPNDYLSDTPAERVPAYGCPHGRDTCQGPGFEGLDPIYNFMDYTHDSCMDTFTTGQGERMNAMWDIYRYVFRPSINIGDCEGFAVMAGSTATCAGAPNCEIFGGKLGVSPGTATTGNFLGERLSTPESAACATDGLAAWHRGRAMSSTSGTNMLAEMGGLTFTAGVHTHGSAINIALASPKVYLDAQGDPNAEFIFNVGSTLTTCAKSEIVLQGGAKAENVYWFLGTALTMGADSILRGNVLAGSAITIGTNGKIVGRAIAQTAVTCETACTVVVDEYDIYLDLLGVPLSDETFFTNAQARWESIITKGTQSYDSDGLAGPGFGYFNGCEYPAIIDDVYMCAGYGLIDGPSNVLGFAGPFYTLGGLVLTGLMKFDSQDVGPFRYLMERIIMHEMGHVMVRE